jgi:hypothetical protein
MSDRSPGPQPQLWGTITDVEHLEASSRLAAATLASIFGRGASTIAAWCALYARLDGEDERYQLWLSAFNHLQVSPVPSSA